MKVPVTDFDDEFDDEEPLPTIGTCKALYTFEGTTNRQLPFHFTSLLFIYITSSIQRPPVVLGTVHM